MNSMVFRSWTAFLLVFAMVFSNLIFLNAHAEQPHCAENAAGDHSVHSAEPTISLTDVVTHEHEHSEQKHHCDCTAHRMNCCNHITGFVKAERFEFKLRSNTQVTVSIFFKAKPSPFLDGPFQPPRAQA